MKTYDGIHDAATDVRRWLIQNEAKLPEHLKDRLTAVANEPSPVTVVTTFAEAVYANEKDFNAEAKDIAAGVAVVCETFGFHGMNEDARGSRIAQALRGTKLAKGKAPEPKTEFQPQPEHVPEEPEVGEPDGE